MGTTKRQNYCIDCGKLLESTYSIRCHSCENIHRWEGKKKPTNHCIDCNVELSKVNYKSLRCHSCNAKHQWSDKNFRAAMVDKAINLWDTKYDEMLCATQSQHCHDAKSVAMKRMWADPTSSHRKYMNNHHFLPSTLEMKFKSWLDIAGIQHVQQYRPKDYHRFYDFYLPAYNALVEIDGDFWHYSAWAALQGTPQTDTQKDQWAYDHGFIMVRIPEHEMCPTIVEDWLLPELESI